MKEIWRELKDAIQGTFCWNFKNDKYKKLIESLKNKV